MSAAGPELPPHLLAKRKRQQEADEENEDVRPSGAKRSRTPEAADKRSRVIGPAAPPAPLNERPLEPAEDNKLEDDEDEDESSDDDDFGPSLPSGPQSAADAPHDTARPIPAESATTVTEQKSRGQRDEWMMVPPKQDDLAARMDPTKVRARGFNTGKSAKGPSEADSAMWTETPEQKRKRLQDEVMGVKPLASSGPQPDARAEKKKAEDRATAEKVKQMRGKSLYDQHQSTHDKDTEDDPSKRAFDREKDVGGGMKIGEAQRREMLSKAKGFSSKFSGGSYL